MARLRKAIPGANKSDMIDAELLARCEQVLGVRPALLPAAEVISMRWAPGRRHKLTVDAHPAACRVPAGVTSRV
jgi:hypothetical protein